ncbi:MAG: lysozyme [Alphaproteobacteria bacterium]|nr:lysozyme [Alphaproteobacteria bacterium]
MRHITEDGLRLIRRFEGFSALPYVCPGGYLTVGYGHVVKNPDAFHQPITEDEATQILAVDIQAAEKAVLRLITVPLRDGQFDALVSFTFNLGAGALQRSTLRRKVNQEEHDDAAAEFLKWVWAGGRKLKGLVKRRDAEALLYLL